MNINRIWAMPDKNTFQCKPIGEFIKRYLAESKISIDPFARNSTLATYTNDLNPETDAQSHMDALDFVKGLEVKPDLVLFDPPYSLRQVKECYEGVGRQFTMKDSQEVGRWTEMKDAINNRIKASGVVLTFGWNSSGMGLKRGFELIEILLVCHGSAHNDTICIAERKQATLFDGSNQ